MISENKIFKVDLGQEKVGYIANLHNVAYQAKDDLISPFMTEAQSEFNLFRQKTLKTGQTESFAVICGDFNFDNMSLGDANCQRHEIFNQYSDYCMERPGFDKPWTVGSPQLGCSESPCRRAPYSGISPP